VDFLSGFTSWTQYSCLGASYCFVCVFVGHYNASVFYCRYGSCGKTMNGTPQKCWVSTIRLHVQKVCCVCTCYVYTKMLPCTSSTTVNTLYTPCIHFMTVYTHTYRVCTHVHSLYACVHSWIKCVYTCELGARFAMEDPFNHQPRTTVCMYTDDFASKVSVFHVFSFFRRSFLDIVVLF
jgi:hypothetical protein